ncbi:glycosyltransferase [Aquincola sp. MAHUQ-54]|uniref:Glycosyltransferase n=1 Tax=Aquincola agrisoli TaxID=3119538 RepID=A0AAW9QQ18_9BURK
MKHHDAPPRRAGADAFLRSNSDAYEWAVRRCQSFDPVRRPEAALAAVATAAGFAAAFHAGRFADGAIENIALRIGSLSYPLPPDDLGIVMRPPQHPGRRRVLHVATHMVGIAGHARMLGHWVRSDATRCHSLVLLDQQARPVPAWLIEAVRASGGDFASLPSYAPVLDRARWLREVARRDADLVVLHHDGHDVIPVVAFAVPGGPPVAVLHHADHQFWLGSSVADAVIHLRSPACAHSAARRQVAVNLVLPVPLAVREEVPSRALARQALGIRPDRTVLLSIGREVKYRPCGDFDFVATAGRILERLPGAHLYVVGATPAALAPHLRSVPHARLHLVGSVDDPSVYRAAADVYLESFPFGSQTALLESALCGLPVVPAYAPLFELLVANDDAVADLLPNPPDEAAYIDQAVALAQDPARCAAAGAALRARLLADHVGAGWQARLEAVYRVTDGLVHRPHTLAPSGPVLSPADVGLSLWHVAADGRHFAPVGPQDMLPVAVASHSAYVSRVVRDFSGARCRAWRAVTLDPLSAARWRVLGVALLGPYAGTLRRLAAATTCREAAA